MRDLHVLMMGGLACMPCSLIDMLTLRFYSYNVALSCYLSTMNGALADDAFPHADAKDIQSYAIEHTSCDLHNSVLLHIQQIDFVDITVRCNSKLISTC